MITVRVEEYGYYFSDGTKWKEKGFTWRGVCRIITEEHPLYNLFPLGTLKINVEEDWKGKYNFITKGSSLCNFEVVNGVPFFICKSLAQGALGKGKKFEIGAYYNLKIDKVNKQSPKIAKTGGRE